MGEKGKKKKICRKEDLNFLGRYTWKKKILIGGIHKELPRHMIKSL